MHNSIVGVNFQFVFFRLSKLHAAQGLNYRLLK